MIQKIPIIKNLSPTQRSIAITVGLLMVYELVRNIPLTFLLTNTDLASLGPDFDLSSRFNFFLLGIMPAITGFFFVELLSFLVPRLKTWRREGEKGRRQLTKWSWIASLLVAASNTYGMILAYGTMIFFNGTSFLGDTSMLHLVLIGSVLLLGFAAACGLAELITRFGIGNGFAVIVGYGILRYMPENIHDALTHSGNENIPLVPHNIMTADPPNLVGFLILIFILIILYQKIWHRVPKFYKTLSPITLKAQVNGKPIDFQLPYLPQGLGTHGWGFSIFILSMNFFQLIPFEIPKFLYLHNSWFHLLMDTIFIAGVSYLGYWLVSHPDRITHNTFGRITFQRDWQYKVDLNAIRAIIIFALFWFLWYIPNVIMENSDILLGMVDFVSIIILAALIKDLMGQFRFMKNAENPRVLATFDNVHFVTVLKGLFEAEGIRFCVQAFEYRRLFYFFEPLVKMRVLVDARDWEKAQELADLENVTII